MLLDVNVLLALAWPNHQDHATATVWFNGRRDSGWATCALTELGFVRLSANPAFTTLARTPADAVALLGRLKQFGKYRFLETMPPVNQDGTWDGVLGHRQVTDVYLARVALHHETRLATFDGRFARSGLLAKAISVIDRQE